ncbi:DUF2283 domain-containing protein [Aggregatilinea lenta]|uniref:DUF2283 domain-containing protein n=1 Tax=Aggregatilinea lenta TaxID=913108 RepID=UPI000E5B956B|nr:DUF2283 domain-containing protein [Aggregatilinea lenta]
MAVINVENYLRLLSDVKETPGGNIWLSYDAEADVLYVSFKQPGDATDSELTDEDVILRYDGDEIIGFTVLHASER